MSTNRGWFAWDVLAVVAFAWALFVALDSLQAVQGRLVQVAVVLLIVLFGAGLLRALALVFRG